MSYTLRLMLNAPLMFWRSRQGFMFMLSLFRLALILAIVIRFGYQGNLDDLINAWYGPPYLLMTVVLLIVVYRHPIYVQIDKPVLYGAVVLADIIAINGFLYRSGNVGSEIYLLLVLPLILTSHYFPRRQSVLISTSIIFSYAITLILMAGAGSFSDLLSKDILVIWSSRSVFLLCATWVYRIQSNFPRVNETRIMAPESARTRLEEMLAQFEQTLHFDTISIQILYRGRLQIVACRGFSNKKEIYQIEFPADDPHYPNHMVTRDVKSHIVDADGYPSFKEPRYHAEHVRTWLGVPLISPSTGECFGLLSVDSAKKNSYTNWDATRAGWFALKVSSFLVDVALGPAALTQATKREDLLAMLKDWAMLFHPKSKANWEDDLYAARELVQFGTKIFNVEDCSIYFLRHRINGDGERIRVLHLVASSAIPSAVFSQHESLVTGHHRHGLTGLAVHRNRTFNLSAEQIKKSPYRSEFVGHLPYLFSKRSRQMMIVPLRDSRGKAIGAIKLENRLGWPSEKQFFPVEEHSFEIFSAMVSLLFENIRLRNFASRQRQNIHNLRSIIHTYALEPIDSLLQPPTEMLDGSSTEALLRNVRNTVTYTKLGLDNILADSAENLLLENEGLVPALYQFVESLKSMMTLNDAANRIVFKVQAIRDDLPFRVRAGFYNIARESILNMARHSRVETLPGGRCEVSFQKVDGVYHLIVEDNGIGFIPQDKLEHSHSFGLRDMHFQKQAIQRQCASAGLNVESLQGHGTKIHVWAACPHA
ncbi:MAG: hypothetical protein C3F07_02750 [Anaerolineales bacterium]|nr:hypothetical protein [Anaerolineae bacterium]PWB76953.1 MAG: hypothetical protein C3F07_02750 [Anaerolineales bacterium]